MTPHGRRAAWTVFRKELRDALRDRRTLSVVLLSSVALGPLVLFLASTLVASVEERADARVVMASGIDHAPSLRNFIERQTYAVRAAPADHLLRLRDRRLDDAVLVVPADFEARLAEGLAPRLEVLSNLSHARSQAASAALMRLVAGFNQEQATLRLAHRGVAVSALEAVQVHERDVADPASRATQIGSMLPFFVLMAVLYGALHAAVDTTAGERERGSLEPLLASPVARPALVIGKWAAVAAVAMAVAVLSCLSFLPGQWLLRSDALAAMFRFGPAEAATFIALLLPLAGALAALLMAIAIRCRTFKEAQANTTVLVLVVSLLPLATLFQPAGSTPWHLWVPALAQTALMTRVLQGQSLGVAEIVVPLAVSAVLTAAALTYVARKLRSAALK